MGKYTKEKLDFTQKPSNKQLLCFLPSICRLQIRAFELYSTLLTRRIKSDNSTGGHYDYDGNVLALKIMIAKATQKFQFIKYILNLLNPNSS